MERKALDRIVFCFGGQDVCAFADVRVGLLKPYFVRRRVLQDVVAEFDAGPDEAAQQPELVKLDVFVALD